MLFIRSGGVITPTDAANAFYKESQKVISQYNSAVINMNKFKKGESGTLRIGIMCRVAIAPIAQAVAKMQQLYPDFELIFDCDKNTNVPYRLASGDIDVGITVLGETKGLDLECEILAKNTLTVLVGKNHRLWRKRPLYSQDLNNEILYDFNPTVSSTKTAILQYFKKHNVCLSDIIPCRSTEEVLLNVARGKGIATAGLLSNELNFSMHNIIDIIPIEDSSLDEGYIVGLYSKSNPNADNFIKILKDCF